mmetsp:Transcript_25299/g.53445  ORF Transcript_25299/g.53445 Transcript_25299/m.53445 type:complete len:115 (-) Transcript_25299:80-424(-)
MPRAVLAHPLGLGEAVRPCDRSAVLADDEDAMIGESGNDFGSQRGVGDDDLFGRDRDVERFGEFGGPGRFELSSAVGADDEGYGEGSEAVEGFFGARDGDAFVGEAAVDVEDEG